MPIIRLKHTSDAKFFIPLDREGVSQWWKGSYRGEIFQTLRLERESDELIPIGEEFKFSRSALAHCLDGHCLIARRKRDNVVEVVGFNTTVGPDADALAVEKGRGIETFHLDIRDLPGFLSETARRDRAGREGFAHMEFWLLVTVMADIPAKCKGLYEAGGTLWKRGFTTHIRMGTSEKVFRRYADRLQQDVLAVAKRAEEDGAKVTVRGSINMYGGTSRLVDTGVCGDDVDVPGQVRRTMDRLRSVAELFFR
jgi:hypothetical protein